MKPRIKIKVLITNKSINLIKEHDLWFILIILPLWYIIKQISNTIINTSKNKGANF